MIIKKLNFSFYREIKKLINRNGFEIPKYFFWIQLWKNDNKKNIGDGLFFKRKLVGYHSYFEKSLVYKKKTYKILVSSNWNVDSKFRKYSIFLLDKFFRKKKTIFLTTTANFKVSEIWKSYGAKEINNFGTKIIYFNILNIIEFVDLFLKKKNNFFLRITKPILILILYFARKLKKHRKKNQSLNYYVKNLIDKEIEYFNYNYEKNNKNPVEKRGNKEISKFLNVIKHNKKIYVIKIYKKKKFIGYSILVKERIKKTMIYRMYLAEIRIKKNYHSFYDEIFGYFSKFSKVKKCSLIEYRNLNSKILNNINKNKYFVRKIKNSPYLSKISSDLNLNLNKFVKRNWETSFLDGDCLL